MFAGKRFALVVLVASVLVVSACGDDSDSSDSSASEDPSSQRHHDVPADDLETWQEDLNAVGCWVGPVDGALGPRTEAATREFQEAKSLAADGLIGGQTETALQASVDAGEAVCAASTDEGRTADDASIHELEIWQHDLNVVGCWAGPEDGTLGPQTEAAISAFQSAAGLPVDGRLGAMTEEALAESAAENGVVCPSVAAPTTNGSPTTTAPLDDGGGALDGSTTTGPDSTVDEGAA